MKKDLKYYIILLGAILIFIIYEFNKPKVIDWSVSLATSDRNPFGTMVMKEVFPDLIDQGTLEFENKTFYEINEEDSTAHNYMVLCEDFNPDEEDTQKLIDLVDAGSNVFVASSWYVGDFAYLLNIEVADLYLNDSLRYSGLFMLNSQEDSVAITFTNDQLNREKYYFKTRTAAEYFSSIDTLNATVLATNQNGYPVLIKQKFGNGNLILSTLPLAFTNYYMLWENNHEFASKCLSYLPNESIIWNTYYQMGRQVSRSPIRFIFSQEPLRWAYYLGLGALIIFVLFEVKRRQRIIPIVKPPENATLEFTQTVGNLYYNHGDHLNLAHKKITYFKEQLRAKYFVQTNSLDEDFYRELSHKSDVKLEEVKKLFNLIETISRKNNINESELFDLSQKLDSFLKN